MKKKKLKKILDRVCLYVPVAVAYYLMTKLFEI